MPDSTDLKPRQEQIKTWWADFKLYRGDSGIWTNLRRRRTAIATSEDLGNATSNAQIRSSILGSELRLRKQVLELESPKVDVVSLETTASGDESKQAKQDAEDARLYFARIMADWQERYDVSGVNSTGQIANGGQMWRYTWNMPPEPPDDWGEDREAWFRQLKEDPIGLRQVPIGSVGFWPTDFQKAEYVIEEIDLPYLEWRKLEKGGKYLKSIEDFKKVAFVGDAQEIDMAAHSDKKVRVCTHAYKVPDTEDWKVCEYVYPVGSEVTDGEVWQEYDSPFGNPYEWCSSGAEIGIETDPHLRFRPDMDDLYVSVMEQNNWLTLLAQVAIKRLSNGNLYIPLYGAQPEVVQSWLSEIQGFKVEGAGAERRGVVPVKETAPGEYMVAPRLEPIPIEIPEAMMVRIEQLNVQVQSERTSRFLAGTVSAEEITQGTMGGIQMQTQAAALPASVHLRHQARFWKSLFRKLQKAIVYWDEGKSEGAQKKYYVIASGDEPIAKGKVEPGSEVYVNAEKMKRSIEILVYVSNLTEQERAVKDQQATMRWQGGVTDFEQYLDELGFEDPQRQMRVLNRERHLVEARAQFAQQEADERANLWSALTGLNLAAQPPMAPMGAPQIQMPAMQNGGGAPAPNLGMMPPLTNGPRASAPAVTEAPL